MFVWLNLSASLSQRIDPVGTCADRGGFPSALSASFWNAPKVYSYLQAIWRAGHMYHKYSMASGRTVLAVSRAAPVSHHKRTDRLLLVVCVCLKAYRPAMAIGGHDDGRPLRVLFKLCNIEPGLWLT